MSDVTTVLYFQMGDLPRNNRLVPRQILGPCRILALAITEQKLQNIKLVLGEKKFIQNVILTTKTSLVLLGMALVTEVGALRALTLLLLIILIGLSFYLVWEALQRCQVVTARLNQEIRDFHELAQDSDSENEN